MNKYPINITSQINEEKLLKGLFLFIFRATKIPPHIGIITNGKLYDITTVGPNKGLAVKDFYTTILKRETEVVFVEFQHQERETDLPAIIEEKVTHYWKVSNEISCLHPVKDFIQQVFKIKIDEANFIFELLPILFKENLIKEISQLGIDEKLENNTFYLQKYTQEDINDCINALTRKEKIANQ